MSLNITAIWEALFDTAPTGAQLSFFNAADSTSGDAATIASIIATPEVQSTVIPVIQIIQLATGLAPDPLQLAAWVNVANSKGLLAVAQAWVNNSNFQAQYGTTSVSIIDGIYAKAFGVIPTTQDVTAWSTQTPAQILYAFATSTIYTDALAPYVNQYLTDVMDAVSGAPGAVFPSGSLTSIPTTTPVETYVLTTGVDTITQTGSSLNGVAAPAALGDDAIVGTLGPAIPILGPTLNPLDTIAPGGSNNSLTLADNFGGQTIPLGVTISNIQSLTLIEEVNAGTGAGNRFDTTVITTPAGAAVLSQFTATSAGIGTDWYNAGAMTNVTATADAGSVNLTGGANDTVTAVKGITISGAADSVMATNSTSGGVSITGGTNVTVNQGGGGAVTVTGESGTVNVTDTNTGSVTVNNGTAVTVTAQGPISIGATTAPTGAITATINGPADAFENALPTVTAYGGASATVSTTGGNVFLGNNSLITPETGLVNPIAGNVTVTDTNSGPNADNFSINASGSVNLTTTPTSGDIVIGADGALTAAGTALLNPTVYPTGNVVVNDSETFGSHTYYGTGTTIVATNGATSVSITGGALVEALDAQVLPATGGANLGDAIGTSTLSSVSFTGVNGDAEVASNALTSVSLTDVSGTALIVGVPTASAANPTNPLFVTLSSDGAGAPLVVESDATGGGVGFAGPFTFSSTGSAANFVQLDLSNATSVTFNGSAALTLAGGSTLPDATSIIADNSGSLALGDVSGAGFADLTSINATGSTGPVSVTLDEGSGSKISFNGAGGGKDTVTIVSNTLGTGTSLAGAAGSTLVAQYNASINDTPLGVNAHISGFSTLAVGHVNSDNGNAAGSVYVPAHGPITASPEVVTETITGNWVAGNTISVQYDGSGPDSITVTAGESTNQVAAALAGAAVASGFSITYNGTNSFTVTGAPGVPFGITASVNENAITGSAGFSGTAFQAAQADTYTIHVSGTGSGPGTQVIQINGIDVFVSTNTGATAQSVANALVAAINSNGGVDGAVTASDAGGNSTTITITANTAGTAGDLINIADSGSSGGITLGAPNHAVIGANAVAQQDTFTLTGTYAAGNVISGSVGGQSYNYIVGTHANDLTLTAGEYQNLATNLAAAIHSETGVTASATNNVVTVTDPVTPSETTGGSYSDSVHVVNGSTGGLTTSIVSAVAAAPAGGDAYYDATGFAALTVGATTGDVTFMNAAAGTPLTITASQGGSSIVEYVLAKTTATSDTLNLTVGVDGSSGTIATTVATATNTAADSTSSETAPTPVIAASIETTLDINSVGNGHATNTVTIDDAAAKSIVITGDQALTLTLQNDAGGAEDSSNSHVTSINASGSSGAVNFVNVPISGSGATFTGGSGFMTVNGEGHLSGPGISTAGVDVYNVGTGGANIGLGFGGGVAGFTGSTNAQNWLESGTGSETVNLIASNAVGSQIDAWTNSTAPGFGSVATVNNWNITTSAKSDDKLDFNVAKTIAANAPAGTFVAQGGISPDLNYTLSNGIITFAGTTLDPLSNFALETLIAAAAVIDGRSGGNTVDAFAFNGNTYVVAIGSNPIVSGPGSNAAIASDVSVTILNGVTGVQGFGSTAASNTILSDDIATLASHSTSGSASAAVYNETGFAIFDTGIQTVGTTSTTLNGLAASAQLNVAGTDNNITVNQVGASGTNSLTVDATANASIGTLTVNGDDIVVINAGGHTLSITSFVDNTATLPTLTITGTGNVTVGGVSGGALTTIDDSGQTGGTLHLTDALAGQQIMLGAGATTLLAEGQGDTITQVSSGAAFNVTADGNGDHISLSNGGGALGAAGASDVISVGNGTNNITADNNGDTITLGTGANTVSATGVGDMITFSGTAAANSSVQVGNGATVTYGTTTAHNELVDLTAVNDTNGVAGALGNFTTLNNVVDHTGDLVQFDNNSNFHDNFNQTAIDVAADANLAAALNSAAAVAGTVGAGHAQAEWFQWQGNTYVVDAEAGAHTGLNATDYVVEITGVVDLSHASFNNGHILTL